MELAARIGTMARRSEIITNWMDGYAFGADGKPYEKPGWSIMIEPVYVANWSSNQYYMFGVGVTDLDCFAVNYGSDKSRVYDVFPCDLNRPIISFYTTLRKWMRLCAPTANIKQVYLYHRDESTRQYTDILIEGGEIVNAAPVASGTFSTEGGGTKCITPRRSYSRSLRPSARFCAHSHRWEVAA